MKTGGILAEKRAFPDNVINMRYFRFEKNVIIILFRSTIFDFLSIGEFVNHQIVLDNYIHHRINLN
jgi:hypothetical protein